MASRFGFASLIPSGLAVDSVDSGEDALVITGRSNALIALCPLYGAASDRVQSHYIRQPSDLPCAGRRVRLRLLVRRFRCVVPSCLRRVFAERFGTTVLAERARRTGRPADRRHREGVPVPAGRAGCRCRTQVGLRQPQGQERLRHASGRQQPTSRERRERYKLG